MGVEESPLGKERCCCCPVGESKDDVDEADELRLRIWRVAGEFAAEAWVEIGGRPRRADLEGLAGCCDEYCEG